jgi:hypothetical protein
MDGMQDATYIFRYFLLFFVVSIVTQLPAF